MVTFNIITLFPEVFDVFFKILPYKKAIQLKVATFNLINLRDYAIDNYGSVDDKPYGGGTGMILRVEPIYNALKQLNMHDPDKLPRNKKTILLSPKGSIYKQSNAREYSQLDEITLICGRYEDVDHRVHDLVTDVISVGNFVLSGGELAALLITESITRLLPGVLEKSDASIVESFTNDDEVEFPQYTRPEIFMGMQVPQVLLSGNHKNIELWKNEMLKSNKQN